MLINDMFPGYAEGSCSYSAPQYLFQPLEQEFSPEVLAWRDPMSRAEEVDKLKWLLARFSKYFMFNFPFPFPTKLISTTGPQVLADKHEQSSRGRINAPNVIIPGKHCSLIVNVISHPTQICWGSPFSIKKWWNDFHCTTITTSLFWTW